GLDRALPGGHVHAQQPAGVAARQLGGGARAWLGRGQGRAHDTITMWGSSGEREARPSTVSGSSRAVVLAAMNAGLTSKGFARRWSFQPERSAPDWTRPLSMPTSLVVHTSAERPQIIAPVRRGPRKSSLR